MPKDTLHCALETRHQTRASKPFPPKPFPRVHPTPSFNPFPDVQGLDEMLFLLGGVALVLQQGDVSDEEFRGGRKPQAGSFFDVSGPPISKSFIKTRTHRRPPPPPPQ